MRKTFYIAKSGAIWRWRVGEGGLGSRRGWAFTKGLAKEAALRALTRSSPDAPAERSEDRV